MSMDASRKQHRTRVQEVVSSKGIRAYLVTERSVPFLSLGFRIRGGSVYDPEGQAGLAYMVAGLLDEGAGKYDSQAFRAEIEDNAIRLSFDADRDSFTGQLKTLTRTRDHAFELLRLALREPRFDEEPVERIRGQIVAELRHRESDPDYLAARAWFARGFPDHGYGRVVRGSMETIPTIDRAAIRRFAAERLARETLVVGVAGDIEAEELGPLLDRTFGDLPERAALGSVASRAPEVGDTLVVKLAVPQSVVMFGCAGVPRSDPDYYAAYTANYILGGGGFSSRLMEEVREKRGLAYGVQSYLYDTELSPLWMGHVATSNERVAQSMEVIRAELAKLAAGEVDDKDLGDAKTYLTGSFPLRLTSNDQLAKMLLGMLVHDLGRDYLDRRNEHVDAVSLTDLQRVSARLFHRDLLVAVAGSPEGINA